MSSSTIHPLSQRSTKHLASSDKKFGLYGNKCQRKDEI